MMKEKQILSTLSSKGNTFNLGPCSTKCDCLREMFVLYSGTYIYSRDTPVPLSTQKVTDHKMVDKFRGESRGGTREARATPYF